MGSFVHRFIINRFVVHKLLMAAAFFEDDIYFSKGAYQGQLDCDRKLFIFSVRDIKRS